MMALSQYRTPQEVAKPQSALLGAVFQLAQLGFGQPERRHKLAALFRLRLPWPSSLSHCGLNVSRKMKDINGCFR